MTEPWNKRYPWEKWFASRRTVRLTRGIDFDCLPHGMAQQIRNEAKHRNKNVSISIVEQTILLRILEDD